MARGDSQALSDAGSTAIDRARSGNAQAKPGDGEARFRALVEASPSISVFIDADGRTGFANSRWEEYFGVSFEEASRRQWVGTLHADDHDRVVALWADCVARGAPYETEYRAVRRDGEARWHLSRFVPVMEAPGRVLGWCGTITDIHAMKTAQERLRESEDRFRVMADGVPLIVWVHDAEGRQEFVNRAFCEYFGVTEAETRDARWRLLAHPEDAAAYADGFMRAIRERTAFHGVVRGRRADGAWRWLESFGRPRWSANGDFLGIVGTSVDITERLESEAALRRSEERFRIISEALPSLVFVHSADGENTYVSRSYCEYVGRDAQALLGRGYVAFIHPDDARVLLPRLGETVARGEPFEAEFRIRRRDGAWRWHLVRTVPNQGADGAVTEWIGTGTDIHVHKETEEALQAKTEQMRALLTSAPLGIAYFDREHRYVEINETLAEINGLPAAVHIGRSIAELLPDFAALAAGPIDRVFASGAAVGNVEMSGQTPRAPGVTRQFLSGFFPVRDASGNVILCGCWATEITELKRAEQGLRDADRRKDRFLATLAHELRNPLAPIRNAVQILDRVGAPEPTAQRARAMIARQTEHLVRLVDDLLEVSRITLGKLELRRERVALGAVVEQAVDAVWPQIERVGLELAVSLPHPMTLDADPVRLVQVLANLLTNACKYTDPGGHIRLHAAQQDGFAVVTVRDDGIGIAPDRLRDIFEMFSQDQSAVRRSEGGLGIGLALSRGLVELHGGTIEARSEGPGRGSEFVVRLPLAQDAVRGAEADAVHAAEPAARGRGRRVLVVDDNRDAADSLAALLKLEGYEVVVAYGGTEALENAATFRPDVILLDLGMPGMDGFEVCHALRTRSGPPAKIVALTGWGQEDDRRRTLQAGFDAHLVKPVDFAQLAAVLKAFAD